VKRGDATIDFRYRVLQAARNGHEAVTKALLAAEKVDVNSKDNCDGRMPLPWMAKRGHEA